VLLTPACFIPEKSGYFSLSGKLFVCKPFNPYIRSKGSFPGSAAYLLVSNIPFDCKMHFLTGRIIVDVEYSVRLQNAL